MVRFYKTYIIFDTQFSLASYSLVQHFGVEQLSSRELYTQGRLLVLSAQGKIAPKIYNIGLESIIVWALINFPEALVPLIL